MQSTQIVIYPKNARFAPSCLLTRAVCRSAGCLPDSHSSAWFAALASVHGFGCSTPQPFALEEGVRVIHRLWISDHSQRCPAAPYGFEGYTPHDWPVSTSNLISSRQGKHADAHTDRNQHHARPIRSTQSSARAHTRNGSAQVKRTPLAQPAPRLVTLEPWHEVADLEHDPAETAEYVVGSIDDRYVVTFDDGSAITDPAAVIQFITNQHTKETNTMHNPDHDMTTASLELVADYTLREMESGYPEADALIQRYTASGDNPHTRYIGGTSTSAAQRKAARALWTELAWGNPSPVMWAISLDTDPAETGFPQLYNAPHIAQLQCFELPDWHAHYRRGVDTFAIVYYLSSKTWVSRTGETLGDNKDKAGYLAVMDFVTGEERAEELRLELVAAVRTLAGCASAKRPTDRDEEQEISEQARRYRRELSAL